MGIWVWYAFYWGLLNQVKELTTNPYFKTENLYKTITLLVASAVSIKLTCAPCVILPLILYFKDKKKLPIRTILSWSVLGAFVAIPWIGRNILISGYFR